MPVVAPTSLNCIFQSSVEKHPDAFAVISYDRKPDLITSIDNSPLSGNVRLTYKQLNLIARGLAESLEDHGIKLQDDLTKHAGYMDKVVGERLSDHDRKGRQLRNRQILNWVPYVRRLADPNFRQYKTIKLLKTDICTEASLLW